MTSKTGNWMIALGAVVAFLGLITLPSALGDHGDRNMIGLGGAVFSLGAVMAAAGLYMKASAKANPGTKAELQAAASNRTARGGCMQCQSASPVIHCKVHQVHLCGDCLAGHYDFRACVYVPSTRRGSGVKTMAARAR
ncbi:MAG TPA: hypothetical protein VGF06_11720 [Terriglobales bacterium]|jgi:hypothetical protein